MDYKLTIYMLAVGWWGAIWYYRGPIYYGPPDGWPDGGCPQCGVVVGAVGGWVINYLVGPVAGVVETTLVSLAGGVLFASAYNLIVGSFGKRGAASPGS